MAPNEEQLHILVLSDRDWTHPQAGGTGTVLRAQVGRWLRWGHRVTVVTASYPGAEPTVTDGSLTIHRVGRLRTVIPRMGWRVRRGLGSDADVVFEVVNGIFWMTPLWLKAPCVTYVQHLSRGAQYKAELGWAGRPLGYLLEALPLRVLYPRARFHTISHPVADALADHGVRRDNVTVLNPGLEPGDFGADTKATEPTIVHLGRLRRYKNVEGVLDVLDDVPSVRLDLVGDGEHRPALEAEIARRGLGDRVTVHGFVSEERKRALLGRAWVNVTASSAEGWGLSVTEAGARGTPSAALAVGGLVESIEDGRTGLLATDRSELSAAVRRLVEDFALRERLGEGARGRAQRLSWDATAQATLGLLGEEKERDRSDSSLGRAFAGSDTGRAAGLAAAAMATNVIGLALTILFARLLGEGGYGSLAAMVSAFLILALPGQALQVTFARRAGRTQAALDAAPELRRWTRDLLIATAGTAVAAALLRHPLANLIGVDEPWGAAAILPAACIWYLLSIQRGVLQGLGRYRAVGASLIAEGGARLALGAVLIGAGLGPTGGFLGTLGSVALMSVVLGRLLRPVLAADDGQAVGRAGDLVRATLRGAVIPLLALALLAWLQNVDVIVVRHQAESDAAASSYAATSVAAKMVIWIGVGLGLFLLPEAARRVSVGGDGKPILVRTLGIVAAVGVPMVAFYGVLGRPLIEGVFGSELSLATGALPVLGAAMSLLACVYLCVQFLLALGRWAFLVPLALAAAIEPVLLLAVDSDLTAIALVILALQAALAVGIVTLSLRTGSAGGASRRLPARETAPETVR